MYVGSNVRYVRASPALYHWAMVVMTQSQGKPDYILSAGLGSGIPPSDWLAESRPLIGSLEVSPRPGGIFMCLASFFSSQLAVILPPLHPGWKYHICELVILSWPAIVAKLDGKLVTKCTWK